MLLSLLFVFFLFICNIKAFLRISPLLRIKGSCCLETRVTQDDFALRSALATTGCDILPRVEVFHQGGTNLIFPIFSAQLLMAAILEVDHFLPTD